MLKGMHKLKRGISVMLTCIMIVSLYLPTVAKEADIYKDIEGSWAKEEIKTWSQRNILTGYQGYFRPNDSMTRGEMAVVIQRLLQLPDHKQQYVGDVLPNKFYAQPVYNLLDEHIMEKEALLVRPEDSITREEAAVMLAKALHTTSNKKTTGFKDNEAIDKENRQYIQGLVEANQIHGRGNNTFNPKAEITRAEIVKILDNMVTDIIDDSNVGKNLTGDILINKDMDIKGTSIDGKLLVSQGASKNFSLEDVTVKGDVEIFGDADEMTINTSIDELKIHGKSNIKIDTKGTVKKLDLGPGAKGTSVEGKGSLKEIHVGADNVNINAKGVTVKVDAGIKELSINNTKYSGNSGTYKISSTGKVTKVQSSSNHSSTHYNNNSNSGNVVTPTVTSVQLAVSNNQTNELIISCNPWVDGLSVSNFSVNSGQITSATANGTQATYTLAHGLQPGNYTLTVSKSGYSFNTLSFTVDEVVVVPDQLQYYVSPEGNNTNNGTLESPLKTIKAGLQAIRQTRQANDKRVYELILRGGTYSIDETIDLASEDSNLIIKAYGNEKPLLTGGVQISGWQPAVHNNINMYEATVPQEVVAPFRQMYVNDQRAIQANSSNRGTFIQNYNYTMNSYHYVGGRKAGYVVSLNQLGGDIRNGENIELVFNTGWRSHRMAVSSATNLNNGNAALYIDPDVFHWSMTSDSWARPLTGKKFYVQNAYGHLDTMNEFYFDQQAGKVYYYPSEGMDMSTAEVWVPTGRCEGIFSISGNNKNNPVENITIQGLTISHDTWLRPNNEGASTVQANFYVNEAEQGSHTEGSNAEGGVQAIPTIDIENAKNITVENNTLKHIGNTGMRIKNSTEKVYLLSNTLQDVSESAFVIGSWTHNFLDHEEEGMCKDSVIGNNLIEYVAVEYFGAPAIQGYYTDGLYIEHNTIKHMAYGGLQLGWNGWQATEKDSTNCRNTVVRNNWVEDFSNEIGDTGGIYTLAQQANLEIYENYFVDAHRYHGSLYFDEGSGNMTAMRNVSEQNRDFITNHTFKWFFARNARMHDIFAFNNFSNTNPSNNNTFSNGGTRVYGNNSDGENNFEQAGRGQFYEWNKQPREGWSQEPMAIINKAGVQDNYSMEEMSYKIADENDVASGKNAVYVRTDGSIDYGMGRRMAQFAVDGYYDSLSNDPFATDEKLQQRYPGVYSKGSVTQPGTDNNSSLLIDLLGLYPIQRVLLQCTEQAFPQGFDVHISKDGSEFIEVAHVVGNTVSEPEVTFDTKYARYVKITPTQLPNSIMQVANVKVFEDPNAAALEEAEAKNLIVPNTENLVLHASADGEQVNHNTGYIEKWGKESLNSVFALPVPYETDNADITSGVTKKPLVLKGILDHRPTVYFDGWDDALEAGVSLDKANHTVSYVARAYADNGLHIYADGNTSLLSPPSNQLTKGQWALWTFATTGGVQSIYKDGVLISTNNVGTGSINKIKISDNVTIRFKNGGAVSHGDFAEFMVYNQGLNGEQVSALFNAVVDKYPSVSPNTIRGEVSNITHEGFTITFTEAVEGLTPQQLQLRSQSGDVVPSTVTSTDGLTYTVQASLLPLQSYQPIASMGSDKNIAIGIFKVPEVESAVDVSFVTTNPSISCDLAIELQKNNNVLEGRENHSYNLLPGTYSYTAISHGYASVSNTIEIQAGSQDQVINLDGMVQKIIEPFYVDDRSEDINYVNNVWTGGTSHAPSRPCYNNTRTHNYFNINKGEQTSLTSVITYTFKGTGIEMYNEMEGGVTNIEVNIYKGRGTEGELIVDGAIADQRGTIGSGQQTGNQKTYGKLDLDYGLYTIEIRPSYTDMQTNSMNGFITLDAFKVYDGREEVQPGEEQNVTFTCSNPLIAHGLTVEVRDAGGNLHNPESSSNLEYMLEAGSYTCTFNSSGFDAETHSIQVVNEAVAFDIATLEFDAKVEEAYYVDNTDGKLVYDAQVWLQEGSHASERPCYNNTRMHNYKVINQGQTTVDQSVITYTFKGTGIEMYNEMEGGVTNIEVNIYKGEGTGGEQVVTGEIADQRGDIPLQQQTGNQKTYEKKDLDYGLYTIEIKPSYTDISTNQMNGFITLDAFRILDERNLQPPVEDQSVTFECTDSVLAYGLVVEVRNQGNELQNPVTQGTLEYLLAPGQYTCSFETPGYAGVSHEITVSDEAIHLDIASLVFSREVEDAYYVDNTDNRLVFDSSAWSQDDSHAPERPCYNNTRLHNYSVISNGATTVQQSVITYTFKGTSIEMYNEMEGGVTNIEVNIYKGEGTGGEQVVTGEIANQRGDIPLKQQTGNQRTYGKYNMEFGVYTIEIKPSLADMNDNSLNGFITLDAFKVLDGVVEEPANESIMRTMALPEEMPVEEKVDEADSGDGEAEEKSNTTEDAEEPETNSDDNDTKQDSEEPKTNTEDDDTKQDVEEPENNPEADDTKQDSEEPETNSQEDDKQDDESTATSEVDNDTPPTITTSN